MSEERIWHAEKGQDVLEAFGSSAKNGLTLQQVEELRKIHGYNELEGKKKKSFFERFLDQFKDFMIAILIVAAAVAFLMGERIDAIIILSIVLLNAIFGVVQESKAEESLEALKKMSAPHAKVLRDGKVEIIDARDLVPGDVALLESGDMIPADARLLESVNLKVEESALTGESTSVDKTIDVLPEEALLADRTNMIFSSSLISYGRAKAVITGTGMKTEVGKIASMIMNTGSESTPLQRNINQLGKTIGAFCLAICAFIFAVGMYQDREPFEMFLISISLAVAAIPEGLPAVVTVVLAIGVQRLVKENAIIRKLPAVETLGSASIICSDKTGTLTQNKMTVVEVFNGTELTKDLADAKNENLLRLAMLCTDAEIQVDSEGNKKNIGDPTEIALVAVAEHANFEKSTEEQRTPRVAEVPFDSDRKLMTTVHQLPDNTYQVITKGAPDALLKLCTFYKGQALTQEGREQILKSNESMASDALRVLAVASRIVTELPAEATPESYEHDLELVGLLGMIDPPRPEAREAVRICQGAGIRPIMITGDHPITAVAIAKDLGIFREGDGILTGGELKELSQEQLEESIEKYSVYARVAPEDKVRIVTAWQKADKIVAMTGDGVNDAPALKKADIGCAMGITGTDVSKEAADMVLTDDNFATIVAAVREGRSIYDNIRKSIQFLLSCNTGEIIVFFIAILMNWDSPLLAIHILWVNLVTDSFPALALGMEPTEKTIMNRKPRDCHGSIFSGGMGSAILIQGTLIGAVTLVAFWISGDHNDGGAVDLARTMAFATLAFSQLFLAWGIRSRTSTIWAIGWFTNMWMWKAFFLSLTLQLCVLLITPLQKIFSVVDMNGEQWLWVIGLSLIPVILLEIKTMITSGEN